jgi:hypothetical protein
MVGGLFVTSLLNFYGVLYTNIYSHIVNKAVYILSLTVLSSEMDLAESGMSDREISAVGYVVMKV